MTSRIWIILVAVIVIGGGVWYIAEDSDGAMMHDAAMPHEMMDTSTATDTMMHEGTASTTMMHASSSESMMQH